MPGKRSSRKQQIRLSGLFNKITGPVGRMLLFSPGKGWQRGIEERRPHNALTNRTEAQQCPCNRWKKLDRYWVQNAAALKPVWDAAVKTGKTTGYQVFMNENMKSCRLTGKLCAYPSPGGGFTSDHFISGDVEVPPAGEWIGKAPPPGLRYSCVAGVCVLDPAGAFASLEECEAVCGPPPIDPEAWYGVRIEIHFWTEIDDPEIEPIDAELTIVLHGQFLINLGAGVWQDGTLGQNWRVKTLLTEAKWSIADAYRAAHESGQWYHVKYQYDNDTDVCGVLGQPENFAEEGGAVDWENLGKCVRLGEMESERRMILDGYGASGGTFLDEYTCRYFLEW